MNAELNLCNILKGHEGRTFYSPIFGNLILNFIGIDSLEFTTINNDTIHIYNNGKFYEHSDEIAVYPSDSLRDWDIWNKEINNKRPKTWDELCSNGYAERVEIAARFELNDDDTIIDNSCIISRNMKLAKSALALIKIYQLIEVGYGGNITNKEWDNRNIFIYTITPYDNNYFCINKTEIFDDFIHIAFHTNEQAKEFLSHSENIQLLKDYFMITD